MTKYIFFFFASGMLVEISVPPGPAAIQPQRKHTDVYINYTLVDLLAQAS